MPSDYPLVSFGHCIVCPTLIYAFWLPLWYLLAIVSSVLLWFMPSDYPFGIFWPLYRLSFFDWCRLITPLVSCGHCIVYPTSIYAFWLPLWYLLAVISSVLLWFVPSDYPFGIIWPLYRLSYFDLRLLITPLVSIGKLYRLSYFDLCFLINPSVSFGHCIVCPSSIDAFWLPLWYHLAIVSSVLLWFVPSDYPFGIFWPLYRLSFFDLCLLITTLVSFAHCIVCPTLIYAFWLFLWYLLAIVSSVLPQCMPSDYPFGIFWPLYRLSYFDLCLLITPLVFFAHCIVCPTLICAFWLPLWYLLANCIVCPTLIYAFWLTHLVSFGHCIVCPTLIYAFWLPIWYLFAIVSSVLLRFMPSDYPFGIFWPLQRLSYFDLCLLINPLVSFGKLYRLSFFD